MPYGPYFRTFDPTSQRAFGRPPDSNFNKPAYKDMAGAHTGTLHQSLVQTPPGMVMNYSTGKYEEAPPTIPTSEMHNFGKGQQPKGSQPFENIKVLDYKTNTVGYAPILLEPEDPSKGKTEKPKPQFFPMYGDVAGQLGLM